MVQILCYSNMELFQVFPNHPHGQPVLTFAKRQSAPSDWRNKMLFPGWGLRRCACDLFYADGENRTKSGDKSRTKTGTKRRTWIIQKLLKD